MSEAEFDMDKAAAEYDASRAAGGQPAPGEGDAGAGDGEKQQQQESRHRGHLSYEDWVAEGNDPDDYVGKNAFQKQHDQITHSRQLEKEVKGLKRTQEQTLEAIGDWQKQESAKIRAELEADLHKAKENEDVEAALEAQQALDEHDDAEKKRTTSQPEQKEELEPVQNFRAANPAIDPGSDDYDPEFAGEVASNYNAMLKRAIDQRRDVTESMIKRWLNKALKDAEELFGDDAPTRKEAEAKEDEGTPGESSRNNRGGQQQTKRRQGNKPREAKAEDYVIDNPVNPRQGNAAAEIRDLIADKYGADDAKAFEQSLTR